MKSNFIIFILALFLSSKLFAENLFIEAKDITLNKDQETTVFRNSVTIKTKDKQITSQFAEYNKKTQEIVLKGNITAKDKLNNIIKTDYAEYNNNTGLFKTVGPTNLITSENYSLEGEDLYFDNQNKIKKKKKIHF